MIASEPVTPTVAQESCRLISWNVAWQNSAAAKARIQALSGYEPDIVARQEVRLADVAEYTAALSEIGLKRRHFIRLIRNNYKRLRQLFGFAGRPRMKSQH